MGRRPGISRAAVLSRLSGVVVVALLIAFGAGAQSPIDNDNVGPHPTEQQTSSVAPSTEAAGESESLPLPPIENRPIGPAGSRAGAAESEAPSPGQFDTSRTIVALAVVIGLIFVVRWGLKKTASRVGGVASQLGPGGRAPSGVLSVLARYPVGRGQTLVLLQLDQRVLLLNQSSDGFRPLAEISDPEEVASILIKTRDDESESLASRFTNLLKGFERDPQIVDRNEWPSRNPTTVDAAMRLFPEAATNRNAPPTDPLAAVRRRLADLEGGAG